MITKEAKQAHHDLYAAEEPAPVPVPENPQPWGACRNCGRVWLLTTSGNLTDHSTGGFPNLCPGSGAPAWEYR